LIRFSRRYVRYPIDAYEAWLKEHHPETNETAAILKDAAILKALARGRQSASPMNDGPAWPLLGSTGE
jgi:hypothetical protein